MKKDIIFSSFFILRLNKFVISDNIKRFFSLNKALCFCLLTIISLGLITGIFCVIKSNNSITLQTMPFILLKNLLIEKRSFFVHFFLKLIVTTIIFIACFFLSFLKFGTYLTVAIFFYMGYLLGISVAIMYHCMKFFLLLSVIVVPCEIFLLFLMGVCSFRFLKFNRQVYKYGNCYIRGNEFKILMISLIVCSIIILLETILLAIIFKICFVI